MIDPQSKTTGSITLRLWTAGALAARAAQAVAVHGSRLHGVQSRGRAKERVGPRSLVRQLFASAPRDKADFRGRPTRAARRRAA